MVKKMKNCAKKNSIILFILISIFLLGSCASKKIIVRERSESFIADINPFEIDTFHLYASSSNVGKVKVSDLYFTFDPRSNYIYVSGRIGVNAVRFGFSYEERKSLLEARNAYIRAYEASAIKDVKPSKKNAFSTGTVSVEWGAAGLAHGVETGYFTSTQYLEKDKPYFLIQFIQTEEEISEVYSPKIFVYISPAQWEKIIEACDQQVLVEMSDRIMEEAQEF